MLMAPFLAVVMALVIAGAVTMFLPVSQPNEPTASLTSGNINGLQPSAVPQAASASAADLCVLPSIILIVIVGIVVGLAVVLLFFRKEPP
jgi:hypothetical protein